VVNVWGRAAWLAGASHEQAFDGFEHPKQLSNPADQQALVVDIDPAAGVGGETT